MTPETTGAFSRRGLFRGAAAAAVAALYPRAAAAIGADKGARLMRLRLEGLGASRQSGLNQLARQLRLQTSTDIALEAGQIRPTDRELFHHPFLVIVGDREPNRLNRESRERLKTWLEAGGTLLSDTNGNSGAAKDYDKFLRNLLEELFPGSPLRRVPPEHVLYRSFYRLDYPAGRVIYRPYVEAIALEGRLAVIHSQNDVVGAWCRDEYGNWEYDVTPGGEAQRLQAMRFGINTFEYALCQDYKDDQVHIDFLLHKRKWKIQPATLAR